jgi:hypothetical protein
MKVRLASFVLGYVALLHHLCMQAKTWERSIADKHTRSKRVAHGHMPVVLSAMPKVPSLVSLYYGD